MIQDKIEWKVKHDKFNPNEDFLKTILVDCGVREEDIPKFLRPTAKCINDPFLMRGMLGAVTLLHKHLEEGSRIFLKADCD